MLRQYELVEKVKAYDPNVNEDMLNRAYVFSMKAHGTQTRASGDPYFSHPLEVAGILTRLKLDSASIATALLHDTVEDTGVTLDEIRRNFGDEVARLVDGVTKLTQLELQSERTKQAENFRKLVLAMSEDMRVLLVKLADRLHNMRTLHFFNDPAKRLRIAQETLDIYVPLAERIGMQAMKEELEDLSFKEIDGDIHGSIKARLEFLRGQGADIVQQIIAELQALLAEQNIVASISGREKSPYSIWQKMQRKNISFEQLSDIMAFRILVPSIEDCYKTLGVVHSAYQVVPGRFKDYISTPKPNGYASIHTTVIGPHKQRIEIQVRTNDMHDIAELGVAAHWNYKDGGKINADNPKYRWLRELLDILENAATPEEFLEHTKLEMFQDQVFCFTPKGDLIALARGSTPVDFAYAIHAAVGDTCVGAKINGRIMPLRTKLNNGDQVEIIRSKTPAPSPAWDEFVVTGKAKAAIRKFVRQQKHEEYLHQGHELLSKLYKAANLTFIEKELEAVLRRYSSHDTNDLIAKIGEGLINARDVFALLHPEIKAEDNKPSPPVEEMRAPVGKTSASTQGIRGLVPGMAVYFARCCHPVLGDPIVGVVVTGRGVTVHHKECPGLREYQDTPERLLDISWSGESIKARKFSGRLHIVTNPEHEYLSAITTTIVKLNGLVSGLRTINRSQQTHELLLDVEVDSADHLASVCAALRSLKAVLSVERAVG